MEHDGDPSVAQKVVVPLLGFAFETVQHTGMNAHDGEIFRGM